MDCFHTAPISKISWFALRPMSIVSCMAQSQPTFRSKCRPNLSSTVNVKTAKALGLDGAGIDFA